MKDKYTMEDLLSFMEAIKPVNVTCTDRKVFSGMCWAYSDAFNMEEEGIDEPSLEVEDTILYLHEIQKIEFAD